MAVSTVSLESRSHRCGVFPLGVQLIHNSANAASSNDADDGLLFIQEMMELMKNTNSLSATSEPNPHLPLSVIPLALSSLAIPLSLPVGPAQFGRQLHGKLGVTASSRFALHDSTCLSLPQVFAQLNVAQPFSACSQLLSPHYLHSRIGIVRRGDCMFIEKARQLEYARAMGGIVIDHNTSLKASNGAIFSMTGDGNNDVRIPLVLMFKDEAFQLLHLLSHQPNLIVYIGEEKQLEESFYQQMNSLESLMQPWNGTSERWTYGHWPKTRRLCAEVPMKLKALESIMRRNSQQQRESDRQSVLEFEHVIDAGKPAASSRSQRTNVGQFSPRSREQIYRRDHRCSVRQSQSDGRTHRRSSE